MSQNPKWPKTMSPTSKIIKTAVCLHHPFWSSLLGTNAWPRCTISSSTKWQATGAPCAWLKHHGKLTGYHGYTTNDAISIFPYFCQRPAEWRIKTEKNGWCDPTPQAVCCSSWCSHAMYKHKDQTELQYLRWVMPCNSHQSISQGLLSRLL